MSINSSSNLKKIFKLDNKITFLNHGSYGACPKPVFDDYIKWQNALENQPVSFFSNDLYVHLERSRKHLGAFVNCKSDDIIFVPNPTYGVANVINNITINSGENVLTTNLEYGSCDRMWFYHSKKNDYKYINSKITLPVFDEDSFCDEFWSFANAKTKYIFISHITSSTGMILPIPKLVKEAKRRGIKTIIDGAHVPAHIELDIKTLDPDYYIGACHKWLCSPKGVSFLYVKKDLQKNIQPQVMSWGWGEEYDEFKSSTQHKTKSRFLNIFQWQGTRDMSAFLSVPKAIEFQKKYDWDQVRKRCKKMIVDTRNEITLMTDLPKICPDNFLGQMATILFPAKDHVKLKESLFEKNIEIPTYHQNGYTAFRISIQGYNSNSDIHYFLDTLKALL